MANSVETPGRFEFADVLRGGCALIVILSHALPTSVPWLPGYDPLNLVGKAGVLIFFVVSGFFLPITCEAGGSLARFVMRRVFRLLPIYWVCIGLTFVMFRCGIQVASAPVSGPTAGDWLLNLTMLQEFFHRPSVLYIFWTLGFELVIYAVFAVLFALGWTRRSGWLVAALLTVFVVAGAVRVVSGRSMGTGGGHLNYFAPLMGLLAYRYIHGRSRAGLIWVLGLGQAGLLIAGWGIDRALARSEPGADLRLGVQLFVWSLAYAAFFAGLAARRWRMPPLLGRVGQISYSVYLLHMLAYSLLLPLHWPVWARILVLFASTLGLSELTYRLVEAPAIRLGRALERHWLSLQSRGAASTARCDRGPEWRLPSAAGKWIALRPRTQTAL
jgi:peptidoglycan/LPS O-acetylase OafA/YrhL